MVATQPLSRRLEVRLFGEPQFCVDGGLQRVTLPPKAILLLCILALKAGQPLDRARVAFTLWADDSEEEAKSKLRRHLHLLARALGGREAAEQIVATKTTLSWNAEGACRIDIVEFERLSRESAHLEEAAALYVGDLLPNFYEEWLEAPRRRLRETQLQNLLTLAEGRAQSNDSAGALEYARAALRVDPWREDAIRYVMQARTNLGDRSGAMREYATFSSRLREEFGAEPLAETKRVFDNLRSAEPVKTNLPFEATTFIGRDAQLQALRTLLESSRMVTITGPGGVGKSRTAFHCARELLLNYEYGVWFIQPGAHCHPDEFFATVAATLGLRNLPQPPSPEVLAQHLRNERVLLLLDNIEGILDECMRLCGALLASCEGVTILATSREPLEINGEAVLRLSPFDSDADALALFSDRARYADAQFGASVEDRAIVVDICRRLDRLPLAIELAAARVQTLTPKEILSRLADRFALLKRSRVPAVAHHQTLHATIAWSYDLLSPSEKELFRRAAVFPSPFTLGALEEICSGNGVLRASILDTISRLIDKSLVLSVSVSGSRRYRLLDSIREFALEQLYDSAHLDSLHERYVAYYKLMTKRVAPQLSGPDQHEHLQCLEDELGNLRAAIQLGETNRRLAALSLDIACNLEQFWLVRAYFAEGRRWIESALRCASESLIDQVRAKALSAAALLASFSDDHLSAQRLEREALAVKDKIEDRAGIAESMHSLGCYSFDVGNLEEAQQFFEDALSGAKAVGDEGLAAKALDNLGLCAVASGNFEQALQTLEESLRLYRLRQDAYGTAWVLSHLGWLSERTEDYERSLELHRESLALRERLADRHGIACSCLAMARCFEALGDRHTAQRTRCRAIEIWQELHNVIWLSEALENYACAEAASGDPHRAAVLFGIAELLRNLCGRGLPAYEIAAHERALDALGDSVGKNELARAVESGRSMPLAGGVAFALSA
jgi:predicted ATPase/DNA-binding SARP family transcriptional activator